MEFEQGLDCYEWKEAVNLKVIARSAWAETPLQEGDAVEIIQAVGGG